MQECSVHLVSEESEQLRFSPMQQGRLHFQTGQSQKPPPDKADRNRAGRPFPLQAVMSDKNERAEIEQHTRGIIDAKHIHRKRGLLNFNGHLAHVMKSLVAEVKNESTRATFTQAANHLKPTKFSALHPKTSPFKLLRQNHGKWCSTDPSQ